ncbi:hypothetical protein [Paenibacillus alvei]|uniref:hypothetical protein n=1 Tax=Paenibacillus alvei TaxID=44250 RepID=UPI0013DBA0F8|nr:hypothetical protein [Paenibacillus alvei]NEZ44581.1 hypothetical protein [Paenibacillus alvei]
MSAKWMEAYIQKRIGEITNDCCKDKKEFYLLYTIFYQEVKHINSDIAVGLLEIEEKLNTFFDVAEIAYRAGFSDGQEIANQK